MLKNLLARVRKDEQTWSIRTLRGFKLSLRARAEFMPELIVAGRTREDIDFRGIAAGRLLNQIDRLVKDMPEKAQKAAEQKATEKAQIDGYRARVGLEFERGAELAFLQRRRIELEKLLTTGEDRDAMDQVCALYQAAKGATVAAPVEAEPVAVIEPSAVSAAPVQVEAPAPAEPPRTNVLTPMFAEDVKEQAEEVPPPPVAPVHKKPTPKRAARRSAPGQITLRF